MRYLHGLLQAWRAAQVELQGEYSIERLYKLQTYAKSTSYTRIALVLVLTALPSLAFAMLLECIPLRAPSDGLSQSLMFWVRTLLVAAESGFVVLQQCRYLLPKLPTSHTQILATSLLIGLCAACVTYGFASVVGYPLPFTLLWGSPVMVTLLAANAVIFWGGFLRENKTERQDLVNYFLVMGLQMTMIYVYPAYAYLYHRLAVAYRALAALLLPIIKLTMKNALGYVFRDKPDLRPDVVVFNVEVYQALFISWCLNGSTTKSAVISLMVTDFCEAVVALHDVSGLLARLTRSCRAQTVSKMRTASITGSTNNGTSLFPPTESIPHQQRIDILEFAVATLEGKRHARYNTRTKSGVASASKISKNAIVPLPESTASNGKYETLKLAPILPPSGLCTSATSSTAISPEISGRDRRFLHLALQLLHLTEFLLLIEFVELIIPTIYCASSHWSYYLRRFD